MGFAMRRRLSQEEKDKLKAERAAAEREAFPNIDFEIVVEDFTWANGEPIIRVVRRNPSEKP